MLSLLSGPHLSVNLVVSVRSHEAKVHLLQTRGINGDVIIPPLKVLSPELEETGHCCRWLGLKHDAEVLLAFSL